MQCPSEDCFYMFKISKMNHLKDVKCPAGHSFCCKVHFFFNFINET